MMTPYQKRQSLPGAQRVFKPAIRFVQLNQLAMAISDNQAAALLNAARSKLFQSINRRSKRAA